MESLSNNIGPSAPVVNVEQKPKRKGRGPSLKKKIIYLQSRVCYLGVPRNTIKV